MKKKYLKHNLVVAAGFLVLFFLTTHPSFIVACSVVAILSTASSSFSANFYMGWKMIMETIGKINSRLWLLLIYVGVVFPIWIFYRLFKKPAIGWQKANATVDFKYPF